MHNIDILLIEDNPGDIELTREALLAQSIPSELHVVTDGAEAMDYLFQRGSHGDTSLPELIILDLNLPKVNGLDILKALKNDPLRLNIPVVVLTSSDAEKDIHQSYQHHANCFITKPASLDDFMDTVHIIESFWNKCAILPEINRRL